MKTINAKIYVKQAKKPCQGGNISIGHDINFTHSRQPMNTPHDFEKLQLPQSFTNVTM